MAPQTDLEDVINSEIKCVGVCRRQMEAKRYYTSHSLLTLTGNGTFVSWLNSYKFVFRAHRSADIYFHQNNAEELQAALELRDAVLRLRRDGAFVAVPLFRVNTGPQGPHPVGTRIIGPAEWHLY